MRNILSSTPEMREVLDGSQVNIFYQNIPTGIKVSPQCELETGLQGRIRPGIDVKVLTGVVATDQRSAGSSLGWDSLSKSLRSVSYNEIVSNTWKESASHFPTSGSVATINMKYLYKYLSC